MADFKERLNKFASSENVCCLGFISDTEVFRIVMWLRLPFPRRKALTGPASRPGGDAPACAALRGGAGRGGSLPPSRPRTAEPPGRRGTRWSHLG